MTDILLEHPPSNPQAILYLDPTLVLITDKDTEPIQQLEVALSGRLYVRELSANLEESWRLDISALPTADQPGGPGGTRAGYVSLVNYLQGTLGYAKEQSRVVDSDGNELVGRFVSGFDSFIEGGGRTRPQFKKGQWFGELIFRKDL